MGNKKTKNGIHTLRRDGPRCHHHYGPDAGKLGMISDIIDQNRCMVYSPSTTLPRNEMSYKRLSLTDLKVKLQRGARTGTCQKAWAESDVEATWEATAWGKKIAARKRKATIGDFQRFKDMKAKQAK